MGKFIETQKCTSNSEFWQQLSLEIEANASHVINRASDIFSSEKVQSVKNKWQNM